MAKPWAGRLPPRQDHDQSEIADCIHRKGREGTDRRDDEATERRADAAGDVEAHAVEGDRSRQVGARYHLAHQRLPGGSVEGGAAADQEGEGKQEPGRYQAEIGTQG